MSSDGSIEDLRNLKYSRILVRRRNCLYALQWFFFSALATLTPFLYSTHGVDLGLSILERTWIHAFSSIWLTLLCTVALHKKFHLKLLIHFRPFLASFLIITVIAHTAILFVPRTQRIARYPKITLNCSNTGSELRIELCSNLIKKDVSLDLDNGNQFDHKRKSTQYSLFKCASLLKTSTGHHTSNLYNSFERNRDPWSNEVNNNDFTSFSMSKCKGVCLSDFQLKNDQWMPYLSFYDPTSERSKRIKQQDPKLFAGVMDSEYDASNGQVNLCFKKSSDTRNCYTPGLDSFSIRNQFDNYANTYNVISHPMSNKTIHRESQIKFHSKLQSWSAVHLHPQAPNQLYPYPSCIFSQSVPVFLEGQSFESIICPNNFNQINGKLSNYFSHEDNYDSGIIEDKSLFDSKQSTGACQTVCNANLLYRGQFSGKYFGQHSMQLPLSPIVCHDIVGDPLITFYSYLIVRCIADLSLMLCFLVIDGVSVYYAANFDTIYGGIAKAISFGSSSFIWPIISGVLIDYYSSVSHKPDYSPAFVLFAGLILIACTLVVTLQIAPNHHEYNYLIKNYNLSNTFIADLCGSNLNCDKIGKSSKEKTFNCNSISELIHVPLKSKILLVFIFTFALSMGAYFSILQFQINTYYLALGASKVWIGFAVSFSFVLVFLFLMIVKPLVLAIGRTNLIALGFIFYTLQFSGNSLLSSPLKWSMLPFCAMTVFTLPLSWIGFTCLSHKLMKLNRVGHLKLQLCLSLTHFAFGRVLGSGLWFFWIYYNESLMKFKFIYSFYIPEFDDKPISKIEMLEDANMFRVFLRILCCTSLILTIIFLVFYRIISGCKKMNFKWRRNKNKSKNKIDLKKKLQNECSNKKDNIEIENDQLKKLLAKEKNQNGPNVCKSIRKPNRIDRVRIIGEIMDEDVV